MPLEIDQFLQNVEVATQGGCAADACWRWTGRRDWGGYGRFQHQRENRLAHRVAYELLVSPIPAGAVLDHTCHNGSGCAGGPKCPHRACVNPDHLEPVTLAVNSRRGKGHGSETHCPKGHPYSGENLYVRGRGGRECRTCHRLRERRRKGYRGPLTHCKSGHAFTPENTYLRKDKPNTRQCRACARERASKRRLP